MKRFALIGLTSLIAGLGCGESTNSSSAAITFYWRFTGGQLQAFGDGTQNNPGCAQAGVDSVHVIIADPSGRTVVDHVVDCEDPVGHVPGVQYTITPVLSGNYGWTLDGLRGGTSVYGVNGLAVLLPNQNTVIDPPAVLDALYADAIIAYDQDCTGISRIATTLYDYDAQSGTVSTTPAYSTDLGPNPAISVACGSTFTVPSLPTGDYDVHYFSALNSAGQAEDQLCNETISHTATLAQEEGTYHFGSLAIATGVCR
jgi:hypothetical protein